MVVVAEGNELAFGRHPLSFKSGVALKTWRF